MKQTVNQDKTIQKTVMTALLFPGFWDRWRAHGVESSVVQNVTHAVKNVEDWVHFFSSQAEQQISQAIETEKLAFTRQHYQRAGLYYNLAHWIFPDNDHNKRFWYQKSLNMFHKADQLLDYPVQHCRVAADDTYYPGRIRVPHQPQGVVIMVNPIDSTKEELFTYEDHFFDLGFVVYNVDGPGQGESYTLEGVLATTKRWQTYVDAVIDDAGQKFSHLSIYLFGTSSGAVWSIKASRHPKVEKAVAVSPAISRHGQMPDYFVERMTYFIDPKDSFMPDVQVNQVNKPIMLVHGNQDVMVNDEELYNLYQLLPKGKQIIEYPEEGHCCNFSLLDVRERAVKWWKSR
ncbi:hypothetical protein J416_05993 [Gracilibacillus halophilus YIM-C55.5]|uniref:Serine aminopeptidase S33 domain-containing protein n=1 Tax=Gracilibacillus halophilus YIM-C55.5 TaxID=1308866 RepID=N4WE80_9BACI|nr:alpha/beta hydrolase [Gracilibacillus halophilus]ENH97539.1 hypothetical protein J416_05993 [Gracilibacillus halophilus YIM-C55.5]